MNGFYWLASYPKSGNTWLRLALRSLADGGAPVDFSDRKSFAILAARRDLLDVWLDAQSEDMTDEEVTALRPCLYAAEAHNTVEPLLRKVHDAWIVAPGGTSLFPPALTLGSIYIVRDPRDVAVSLAHHKRVGIDDAIAFMNDPSAALAPGGRAGKAQLRQPLLTWSGHVESWLGAEPAPLLVSYERMLATPCEVLAQVATRLGWSVATAAVARAVEATSFDTLQATERRQGFQEGPLHDAPFFRRGIAGGWRDSLTAAQVKRIEADHGAVMDRLGYGRG